MPDFLDLLKSLNDNDVRYVVIGGYATVLHGGSNVTIDLDLAVALDEKNGDALIEALREFEPYPPRYGSAKNFVWDIRSFSGRVISLATTAGRIDILRAVPGIDAFEDIWERSHISSVRGVKVRIASINDLIKMKQAADRPKDREHIKLLEALKSIEQ